LREHIGVLISCRDPVYIKGRRAFAPRHHDLIPLAARNRPGGKLRIIDRIIIEIDFRMAPVQPQRQTGGIQGAVNGENSPDRIRVRAGHVHPDLE
jgi:hypothetical protein